MMTVCLNCEYKLTVEPPAVPLVTRWDIYIVPPFALWDPSRTSLALTGSCGCVLPLAVLHSPTHLAIPAQQENQVPASFPSLQLMGACLVVSGEIMVGESSKSLPVAMEC